MQFNKHIFIAGFAIFSMFFGAGNLVFPLLIGQLSCQHYVSAIFGVLITGVLVPLMGLVSMLLFRCNREAYFGSLGNGVSWVISFLILSLIGPFGAGPRCINVACGSFQAIWPGLSPVVFNIIFCVLIAWCIFNRDGVIAILGGWLSPALLVALLVIIYGGIKNAPPSILEASLSSWDAFCIGLRKGYQTMDLLASFFFSTTTYLYLKAQFTKTESFEDKKSPILKFCLASSLIGTGALAFIYISLVMLGANYSDTLTNVAGDKLLIVLSEKALGKSSLPLVAVLFTLACLTTAVAVLHLFSEFLKEAICKNKISERTSLFITLLITYVISLFGFTAICNSLEVVMEFLYPALITYATANIISKFFIFEKTAWCFYGVLGCFILIKFL